MSNHSTQNATPTVQVQKMGLTQQTQVGKVLATAGIAAGLVAAVFSFLGKKLQDEPQPEPSTARAHVLELLDQARMSDVKRMLENQGTRAKDTQESVSENVHGFLRRNSPKVSESATRIDLSSLLDRVKSGSFNMDEALSEAVESPWMEKLRGFGDEAREIVEQGKMKTTESVTKAQSDTLPQAMAAFQQARTSGEQHLHDASDQARAMRESLVDSADRFVTESRQNVDDKRQQATEAVVQGGRDTRSLALWLSAAGLLVYATLLNKEQQEKAKQMSADMAGTVSEIIKGMLGQSSR